ncbi:MAG: ABC transporter ATP-binding protein [Nitrososphaerales archaeon]
MLKVEGLTVYYGKALALNNVSLHIDKGELVALIGPNGAGKTTLLKTISGLVKPTEGQVLFNGKDLTGMKPNKIAKYGLAHCPEHRRLAPDMTVLENLELGAYLRRDKDSIKEDLEYVFQLFPVLKERCNQKAGTMSGGEQQMLAIGRSLMARPQLLLLDEPLLGLSPIMKGRILSAIKTIRSRGVTTFLVEQDARSALKIVDRVYVLENGAIVMEGSPNALSSEEHIRTFYLGT